MITPETLQRLFGEALRYDNLAFPEETTSQYEARKLSLMTGKSITNEEYMGMVHKASGSSDKYAEQMAMLANLVNEHFER